ncbi:CBS domain-containing protein [Mariniblastus sp.]|mgnify:CR=1 FL=1|nr:CBS domain-containing protein [bacterium]MDA7902241.1 CBS domain-containing protein [Mariniblastus sp.]MDA7906302.1 CBS domain-containing protein [Mariniblastus sp.]MDC3223777.1 CBS domain-containing protein [Mariniblastus sp.]
MLKNRKNFSASDIMVKRLITLDAEMDVFKAIELLSRNKISGAPVIDSNRRLLGMFTEKSCLEVMVDAAYEGLPANEVGAFMSDPADTITEDTGFLSMAQVFLNKRTRRLPVLEKGILVGQVSRRDLIHATIKIIRRTPDRQRTLLYLSALCEMQDSPMP